MFCVVWNYSNSKQKATQYIWDIDQAWGQGGWISTKFFFMRRTRKRTRPISSHLDRTCLVNKGFVIWDKTAKHDKFSLRDKVHIPSGQDSSILPARVANNSDTAKSNIKNKFDIFPASMSCCQSRVTSMCYSWHFLPRPNLTRPL